MISLTGLRLNELEKHFINNDNVGGIILFSRNYSDKQQLIALIKSIRAIKSNIIIAVDHEGGSVWRFHEGFTHIPDIKSLGDTYTINKNLALDNAYNYGSIIARELKHCGVDFSFTPVLDINYSDNSITKKRAFSNNPQTIIALAKKLISGLHSHNMISVGKHYPGHGFVKEDSHITIPVDDRDFIDISKDLNVFSSLKNNLDAIMTAHVIYKNFDSTITTFSKKWLDYLKNEIDFSGIIFSDDLSMSGAKIIDNIVDRIYAAINAGCDMVLICNDVELIKQALTKQYAKSDKLLRIRQKV